MKEMGIFHIPVFTLALPCGKFALLDLAPVDATTRCVETTFPRPIPQRHAVFLLPKRGIPAYDVAKTWYSSFELHEAFLTR
ncbi:MAG: hypothetical protein OJF49_002480 [Ktedonobacterales bacterium]|nr:MAG: hypothetical protein OJF49_002480 [Ktedonobacterales bacterium]